MFGREDVSSYEELFDPEDWAAMFFGASEPSAGDWGQEGGEPYDPGGAKHDVTICDPPGQYQGNEDRFALECNICESIGAADTMEEAEAIARLHEAFVATLVEQWSVDR
jgi:hypothetical protein